MWIFYAAGSSFFAGITAILAKCGIQKTDSDVATAIRTVIVLLFSWLIVFMTGAEKNISGIETRTLLFLVLSGLSTGASWLCYFHALQNGPVSKVVPIDKFSTVLTILLALIIFHEGLSKEKLMCILFIAMGTMLMVVRSSSPEALPNQKSGQCRNNSSWLIYAILSSVFASLTAILGKIGIVGLDSNLGTAIRTAVVLVMAWMMVGLTGKQKYIDRMERRELLFIILSGLTTGASWLCYYRALQEGPASVVVPIDKLSMLVTIAFSVIVFRERLHVRSAVGVMLITAGTLFLVFL